MWRMGIESELKQSICVHSMQILISLVIVVLIKGQHSVIWRNIEMIIDDGGIYSCDATDEVTTQTFVFVDEN